MSQDECNKGIYISIPKKDYARYLMQEYILDILENSKNFDWDWYETAFNDDETWMYIEKLEEENDYKGIIEILERDN